MQIYGGWDDNADEVTAAGASCAVSMLRPLKWQPSASLDSDDRGQLRSAAEEGKEQRTEDDDDGGVS